MAEKEFFLSQIERLKSNFGEHFYRSECVGFIWLEVKHLRDNDLKEIVDDFIADLSFAPKRKLFMEAITNRRLFRYQAEKEQRAREVRSNIPRDVLQRKLRHISQFLTYPEEENNVVALHA